MMKTMELAVTSETLAIMLAQMVYGVSDLVSVLVLTSYSVFFLVLAAYYTYIYYLIIMLTAVVSNALRGEERHQQK